MYMYVENVKIMCSVHFERWDSYIFTYIPLGTRVLSKRECSLICTPY